MKTGAARLAVKNHLKIRACPKSPEKSILGALAAHGLKPVLLISMASKRGKSDNDTLFLPLSVDGQEEKAEMLYGIQGEGPFDEF